VRCSASSRKSFRRHARRTVKSDIRLAVHRYPGTGQRDARENSSRTRIGHDFRLEANVCGALNAAPDRSGRDRGVRAESQFAIRDVIDAFARLEHQDHVGRLHTGLKAEAATGQSNERRVGPGIVILANDEYALATPRAKTEADSYDVRNDSDRVGS